MNPPSSDTQSSLSQLQRINEQCNRFEAAWRSTNRPRIEDYLGDGPDNCALVRQLILLDVDYRRQQGECPQPADYLDRFPAMDHAWLSAALSDPGTLVEDLAASIPAQEFLDRLAKQGLLSPAQHQTWRERLAAAPRTSTAALAGLLVAQGKIPDYQAQALAAPIAVPLVLGPYVLDGWIAAGGMGNVFRATHRQMKRTVAVKVMHGGAMARPEQRQRFQREVVMAAQLRHPHIITAFDAGEQDGVTYLVTEYVAGEDLGRLVKRVGPLAAERAADLIRQAALGLGYAHAQGIIHRDVKPSNLLLGQDGVVRVLDVGLARALSAGDDGPSLLAGGTAAPDLTGAGGLMGTLDYMAPEQAEDPRRADERSDVYSLGCTLYFLLTGRHLYENANTIDRLLAHRQSPIPPLRSLRPDVPVGMEALLHQLLAKKPEDRPPSMAAVAKALEAHTTVAPARRLSRRVMLVAGGSAALAGAAWLIGFPRKKELPPLSVVPFDARAEQSRWASALEIPIETENAAGMRLVLVPPGSFVMGTPPALNRQQLSRAPNLQEASFFQSETQREETIREPFYLGATEVTVGQFRRFVQATRHVTLAERAARDEEGGWGWHPQDGWRRRLGCSWQHSDQLTLADNHPVGNITWSDAQAFCRWLTGETGSVCRLPTEAEWEFACRAGAAGLWCFGDDEAELPIYAWADGPSGRVFHPVAGKRANAFGLFDMHGNLAEWCAASAAADRPSAEVLGAGVRDFHPARGGHFLSPLDRTRSAARRWEHANTFGPGFRVLQAIPARP